VAFVFTMLRHLLFDHLLWLNSFALVVHLVFDLPILLSLSLENLVERLVPLVHAGERWVRNPVTAHKAQAHLVGWTILLRHLPPGRNSMVEATWALLRHERAPSSIAHGLRGSNVILPELRDTTHITELGHLGWVSTVLENISSWVIRSMLGFYGEGADEGRVVEVELRDEHIHRR